MPLRVRDSGLRKQESKSGNAKNWLNLKTDKLEDKNDAFLQFIGEVKLKTVNDIWMC